MRSNGFTIFELLIALAIMSILIGGLGALTIRSLRAAELRSAATQVLADLQQARSKAQRSSSSMTVGWPAVGGKTYTITQAGNAAVQSRTLPNNITLTCKTTCNTPSLTYSAPYGELGAGATGIVLQVRSPFGGINPYDIRIVGVTGKPMMTVGAP